MTFSPGLLLICVLVAVAVLAIAYVRSHGLPAGVDLARIRAQVLNPEGPVRRMWPLWLIFVLSFGVVLSIAPMKAGLTMYGIGKVALGGIIGYVIDVCVYRAADRPHLLTGIERGTAWKRRAWIVCACIIAMAFVP